MQPSQVDVFKPIDFKTRFPALDGIRALAVTMVFLTHYGGGAHGGAIMRALNIGRQRMGVGVDVFFVLSGFLITGILYDTRHDSHYFKRFFARRSVRIFPVYYLLFAVLALLTPVLHFYWHAAQAWFLVYLGNIVHFQGYSIYELHSGRSSIWDVNLSHLWSLCVEEQFYLLWPAVIWLVRDRVKLLWTSFGLCALVLGLRVAAVLFWPPAVAEQVIPRMLQFRLDDLVIGGILALLLRGEGADGVQRACKWLFFVAFAAWVSVLVLSPSFASPWGLSINITFGAIWSFGLVGMTLRPGSIAFRLFSWRPARVLGKYSYGFYVWHLVFNYAWIEVLILMNHLTGSVIAGGILALSLGFATTFLVAKLSYDLFEVRFLGIKRRFEYDSEVRTHQTAFAADGN